MKILNNKKFNLTENLVTSEKYYLNRRSFLFGMIGSLALPIDNLSYSNDDVVKKYNITKKPMTKYNTLTRYNNFFEFGTTKQIWKAAQKLDLNDWKVKIKGGKLDEKFIDFETLNKKFDIEERIYKFRCVEAWSMVVPWNGFELSKLISFLEPDADFKYVAFKSFFDPNTAKNQKQSWYPWPYTEIITMEEAKNELAFIATGVYGKSLPKQNGAPLRLVLPWKYGFKSIKSIVEIEFLKESKKSFWNTIAPKEYGFWANVNPKVPHKRWSQEFERDIESNKKFPTQIFNGYERWVSYLYKDINVDKLYF